MAGPYKARSTRGKYNQAGYVRGDEQEMYIAKVPAGSAQDRMMDRNRTNYRSDRPWNDDTPEPIYEKAMPETEPGSESPKREKRSGPKAKKPLLDRLGDEAKRDRGWLIAYGLAFAVWMTLMVVSGKQALETAQIQGRINEYEIKTQELEQKNQALTLAYTQEYTGKDIRDKALKMGMLRPERIQTERIYIRMPENMTKKAVQNIEEPRMAGVDILLALLNLFHIGE